jgi:hypothetical protein
MQLNECQRRALLCRTQYIFNKGYLLAKDFPFLGDVMGKSSGELHNYDPRNIGSVMTDHIGDVVRELTDMALGTKLDERTTQAFTEAKEALEHPEVMEETAWPKWYANGDPAPPAHK